MVAHKRRSSYCSSPQTQEMVFDEFDHNICLNWHKISIFVCFLFLLFPILMCALKSLSHHRNRVSFDCLHFDTNDSANNSCDIWNYAQSILRIFICDFILIWHGIFAISKPLLFDVTVNVCIAFIWYDKGLQCLHSVCVNIAWFISDLKWNGAIVCCPFQNWMDCPLHKLCNCLKFLLY